MNLPQKVQINEVGLRDGLQNEDIILPVSKKLEIIDCLINAGIRRMQFTSFVHPKIVPQMADAETLIEQLIRRDDVIYSGLILNMRGLERAYNAGLMDVDLSMSVSNTHSCRNTGRIVAEKVDEFTEIIQRAQSYQMPIRFGLQCVYGCVYEGKIDLDQIEYLVKYFLDIGIDELSLADSTGMANPKYMQEVLDRLMPLMSNVPIILHLHDTRGLGLANVVAALEYGVTTFDTAFGGLGGCPFIEGATGNIATEDTIYLLEEMGIETGVDRLQIAQISQEVSQILGKEFPSKLYKLNTNQEYA